MGKLRAQGKAVTVGAIHANAGVEHWYARTLQGQLTEMRNDLLRGVRAAWRESAPAIGFAHDASSTLLLKQALSKWSDLWINRLDAMARETAASFATRAFDTAQSAMKQAFKRSGFTVAFKPTARSVEAYRAVLETNVTLIKSIPEQFRKDVEVQVWQSVMAGRDLQTLTQHIQKSYGVAWRRAATIALDQNNKAKAVIENTRRMGMGLEEAYWQHSHGGKEPRPTHIGVMNGAKYTLKQGMWDPDEEQYVWPGELIKCRCTSRVIVPGYNDVDNTL